MLLNSPKKFKESNIVSGAISTKDDLIAQSDIIIQYNEQLAATIDDSTWVTEKNYDPTKIYNWIRISFDGGKNFPFTYKLNTTKFNEEFNIIDCSYDESNTEYPYYYRLTNVTSQFFKYLKNSPLTIVIGDETSTINIYTPIKWDNSNSSITIYFSANFYNIYKNLTCYVSN